MSDESKMWVSIREAAVIYEVTVRTIRDWIRNKKIDARKLDNGRWMVAVEEGANDDNED